MSSTAVIFHDGIGPVLDYLVAGMAENVAEAMGQGAEEVESYAQMNAPWNDITGAARSGLTASVSLEDGEVVLELAHTVEHGYWLETIQDGSYAIIMPTLEALGPRIIQDAGGQVVSTGGF
jgi:hypothetical protein